MTPTAGHIAMGEALTTLVRPHPAPVLPSFERLAPPPPERLVGVEIETRSRPGDVVVDLHARGGWVARGAIARLRRGYSVESEPLTRLLADLVLRPPDLRHFDAAVNALAIQPFGDIGLRQALNELYASRCQTCRRPVVVEEFVWEGSAAAPILKSYRCTSCRDRSSGAHPRHVPTDDGDAERLAAVSANAALQSLRSRFPVPDEASRLPDQILALYTPRTAVALEGLVSRLEGSRRAASIEAALRIALVHVLLPASRLNSYPGRVAAVRIAHGKLRSPTERKWRERNPWLLFEEGCRLVRGLIQWLEAAGGHAPVQARFGDDLLALLEGSANAVVKVGTAVTAPASAGALPRVPFTPTEDDRSRVRLVLTQPPLHPTGETVSFAYLATSIALGHAAASALRLEPIFGTAERSAWARDASDLRSSLLSVGHMVAPDAQLVLVLDRAGAPSLVASVLGAVGAGYALDEALLMESLEGISGTLVFRPRAEAAPALGPQPEAPLTAPELAQAVVDVAVGILQRRGEPATFERLLGEVLVGLDRRNQLRRFAGTRALFPGGEQAAEPRGRGRVPTAPAPSRDRPTVAEPELWRDATPVQLGSSGNGHGPHETVGEATDADGAAGSAPAAPDDLGDEDAPAAQGADSDAEAALPEYGGWAVGEGSTPDHVELLLELVVNEIRRPGHPRLYEVEPGRWWLRQAEDLAGCDAPLSDRVEWAVFSLLSTSGGIAESAFHDRIFRMFRGHDTPDEALVAASLESYRSSASTDKALTTDDDLQARYREHGELVGMLAEYGGRLGLRRWISPHEQRRIHRGRPLADVLTVDERHATLTRIARGDEEAIRATDCIWYLPGKATFLFEVEWTAMISEALLARGPRIATDDGVVRFLVVAPERAELVRLKLARSPVLRQAMEDGNWHVLKSDHLRALVAEEEADLSKLQPLLGLDPEIEKKGEQLPLFG